MALVSGLYISLSNETNAVKVCSTRASNVHFRPRKLHDILATVLCFVGGSLASSSGIGGGGLYVPILMVVGRYSAQLAVSLSTVIILGDSIPTFIIYSMERHPKQKERPLIDYNIVLIAQPIILCGTSIGILLNMTLPNWVLVILLLILLLVTGLRTFSKAIKTHQKEVEERCADARVKLYVEATQYVAPGVLRNMKGINHDSIDSPSTSLLNTKNNITAVEATAITTYGTISTVYSEADLNVTKWHPEMIESESDEYEEERENASINVTNNETKSLPLLIQQEQSQGKSNSEFEMSREALSNIKKQENRRFSIITWLLLLIAWSIVFVLSLLRGGKGRQSIIGVKNCSSLFWILSAIQYPVLLSFSALASIYLHYSHRRKVSLDYQFAEGDIRWTLKNTTTIPFLFFVAGIVAGMLGIGGGIITGPLMLELGLLPQVAVATSGFMLFFTASSTVSQFLILGTLPWDYGIWYFVFGFLGGICGQLILIKIVKRYNKFSWIVFICASIIMVSALLMGGMGFYVISKEWSQGKPMGFKSPCK